MEVWRRTDTEREGEEEERTVISMAAILVDYENVSATDGLKGTEYLEEKDTLIIFYSQCCEKIRAEYIEQIESGKCSFLTYKLVRAGKNALDFYIAAECGILTSGGCRPQAVDKRENKAFEYCYGAGANQRTQSL